MSTGENHIFSPAFDERDIDEILSICDHIVFNSPRQLSLYGKRAKEAGLEVGLRINPECSTQVGHAIYDPCAPGSRLGTRLSEFQQMTSQQLDLLDGLHFHTLCEQNSDDLKTTLDAVEEKFGKYLNRMKWINFGGGHHITREDYDIPCLEQCIRRMQREYGLEVYLEPGEAVALNAGELHCKVMEVQAQGNDGVTNVIVDTSAACHMPDVIEMPYTPPIITPQAYIVPDGKQIEGAYRLGGPTCLSGDIIGIYQFTDSLHEGDEVVFGDMAIYSMVKTNTFNGMPLPKIYIRRDKNLTLWKQFCYEDFKSRI
jgi:carboxynorspermidine decarboxylase